MYASLALCIFSLEKSGLARSSPYPVSQEGREILYATVTENDILNMLPEA